MASVHEREYGAATTIDFELFEVDGVDFRVDATHASGDTTIMKDEGAEANTASAFVDEGQGYSIALSATEMQAARIVIYVVDQTATKVWLDRAIIIETFGHASANDKRNKRTITLPGQEAPSLSPTEDEVLGWLHKMLRNKKTQTSTQFNLFADDESTVDAKATVSASGQTATVAEMVTGP